MQRHSIAIEFRPTGNIEVSRLADRRDDVRLAASMLSVPRGTTTAPRAPPFTAPLIQASASSVSIRQSSSVPRDLQISRVADRRDDVRLAASVLSGPRGPTL